MNSSVDGMDDEHKDILYEELNNGSMYVIISQQKTISGYSKEYYCYFSLNAAYRLWINGDNHNFSNVDEASAHVEEILAKCGCRVIDEGMMVFS
jgi:hypothetical protein